MPSNFIELNSALARMIESNGNDRDAASLVIKFAQDLPNRRIMVDADRSSPKNPDVFTGVTPETGNVTVRTEQPTGEKKESFAGYKARVGQYRIWRTKCRILFHHYWASGPTTSNPLDETESETFVLSYHPASLEMEWFAKIGEETRWRINFLVLRVRRRFLVLLNQGHEGERLPYNYNLKIGGRIDPEDVRQARWPLLLLMLGMVVLILGIVLLLILALGLMLIHFFP